MADVNVSSATSREKLEIDVTKLTPVSPEVICKQATINIGTIGHVAHGKSTVVKALSGVQTVRFKNELERNITIKLDQEEKGEEPMDEVHSTVGPLEDEDLQVLAELDSTISALKKTPKKSTSTPDLLESPPRPSVIQHTLSDSPSKRNLTDEMMASSSQNDEDAHDVEDLKPQPSKLVKRRPGPKSKTQPQNEVTDDESKAESIEKTKKKDTEEDESSDESTKRASRRQSNRIKAVRHSDSDDSGHTVENKRSVKRRSLRSRTSLTKSFAEDTGSDSDLPPPVKKNKRTDSVMSQTSSASESSRDSKRFRNLRISESQRVKRDYRTKKTPRRSRRRTRSTEKSASKLINRGTPSETREVKDDGPPNYDIGLQSDGEYEVEKVLCSKKIEGRQHYFVKWKGWPDFYNTWEPVENLIHSQEALLEFFQSETRRGQERLISLGNKVPGLVVLPGRQTDYERDIVMTLTKADFENMEVDTLENLKSILPNHRLLSSHINKIQKQPEKDLTLKIRKMIAIREFVRLRFEQLESLRRWEAEIKVKLKGEMPLTVSNDVDLEGPPDNFCFIKENLAGEGVVIPDEPPVGCDCTNCEEDSSCCGAQSGSKFAYTSEGLLKVEHGTPVYECNKRCSCGSSCENRVVQKGRTVNLHIYRTPNMGWGVKVMEHVPQGKFICEYIGEVVKRETADERIKTTYKGRPLYIFDLDFNDAKEFPYTVDAFQYGNVAHFINHSCEPNLAVYSCWIDCLDPNLPRLAMFAIRDIKAGEELTFDYSAQYHRKRKLNPNSKQNEKERRPGKTPCKCNSVMCRQIMF